MKKYFLLIFFIFLFFTSFIPQANAHFPATAGDMTITLHIDPNDHPISGQQANLYFLFDYRGRNFQLSTCNCIITISERGKQIFQKLLNANNDRQPSIWGYSMPFTFPQNDVYRIDITGKPKSDHTFQSFDVSWYFRVDPDSPGIVSKRSSDLPYLLGGIGALIVFLILFSWFIKKEIIDAEEKEMNIRKNIILNLVAGIISIFLFASPVFAHVIVTPSKVGIASLLDFIVSIPNEKDNPVTSVRLLIPQGVSLVSPNTVSGWTITTKSSGNNAVLEIDWTGGSIPVGQRAEFIFQAQVPPQPTTLVWKAYQTYSDGTVMSWDVNPASLEKLSDAQQDALADKENKGKYSTTTVINDLTNAANTPQAKSNLPMIFSIIAIAISGLTFGVSLLRRNN